MTRTARSAVLILGVYHQTLAVIRSLRRAGYPVILGRGACRSVEEFSNCCDGVWVHPPFGAAAFGAALEAYLDTHPEIGFLFPIGEDVALTLAKFIRMRERDLAVVMVEPALLHACLNKPIANRIAASARLNVPRSQVVRSVEDLVQAALSIGFPVIIKSPTSRPPIFGRKAYLLRRMAELEAVFTQWPGEHEDLMIQAYVEGPLEACDFVAQAGRVVGYFEAASVRTDMADGTGFAVDFLSTPVSADVLGACRQFCAATGYQGPGLLQFIRSNHDGKLYFVENNPRLSAGIAQPIMCGQDMPLLSLDVAAACRSGQRLACFDERASYATGMRTHWLYRDVQGILCGGGGLTTSEMPGRIKQLVVSLLRADNHMVWQWRDPLPSVLLYARLFRQLCGQLLRRHALPHD